MFELGIKIDINELSWDHARGLIQRNFNPKCFYQEQVIENSSGATIDLSTSLSRAIAEKAGPDALEQACKPLRPLAPNMIKMMDGFDIATCENIFHCNVSTFADDNDHTVRDLI